MRNQVDLAFMVCFNPDEPDSDWFRFFESCDTQLKGLLSERQVALNLRLYSLGLLVDS